MTAKDPAARLAEIEANWRRNEAIPIASNFHEELLFIARRFEARVAELERAHELASDMHAGRIIAMERAEKERDAALKRAETAEALCKEMRGYWTITLEERDAARAEADALKDHLASCHAYFDAVVCEWEALHKALAPRRAGKGA